MKISNKNKLLQNLLLFSVHLLSRAKYYYCGNTDEREKNNNSTIFFQILGFVLKGSESKKLYSVFLRFVLPSLVSNGCRYFML